MDMRVHQPLAVVGGLAHHLGRAERLAVKVDRFLGTLVADREMRGQAAGRRLVRGGRPRLSPLISLPRSEEHTSELQSLMLLSYAFFCLKKNKIKNLFSRITYLYTNI